MKLPAIERISAYTDEQLDAMSLKELLEIAHGTINKHTLDHRLYKQKWNRRKAIITPAVGNVGKKVKVKKDHPLRKFTSAFYSAKNLKKAEVNKKEYEAKGE